MNNTEGKEGGRGRFGSGRRGERERGRRRKANGGSGRRGEEESEWGARETGRSGIFRYSIFLDVVSFLPAYPEFFHIP